MPPIGDLRPCPSATGGDTLGGKVRVIWVDRLTADDLVILWPDALWPQEIGALAILDGSSLLDANGALRIEPVRSWIAARLPRVPRLRQVIEYPRRGLGGPIWVDAPDIDLCRHIGVSAVRPPGDESALLAAVQAVQQRRLDRSRPLWQMWLLPGLPDDRVGLFIRLHHVVADGIAGLSTLTDLLDPATAPEPPPWRPIPPPNGRELWWDNARRQLAGGRRLLRGLSRPDLLVRHMRAAWPDLAGMVTTLPPPRTTLDHDVGAGRAMALISAELAPIRAAAHHAGATVNDALLTAAAGGLGSLLLDRGESVAGLRLPVYVPVSLRSIGERVHARGNSIGQLVVALPLDIEDPFRRLALIATATAAAKEQAHPALGSWLNSRLARRLLLAFLNSHPVNVTTADIPGPTEPLELAGAPIIELFGVLPLIGRVTVGVGALSYLDRLAITVVADRNTVPDLGVFTAAAERDLDRLGQPVTEGRPALW